MAAEVRANFNAQEVEELLLGGELGREARCGDALRGLGHKHVALHLKFKLTIGG